MSSWKNAAKSVQRVHKERHQPEARKHLGVLEKKKDYKRRAKYFQHKKNTIRNLSKRAQERNPDEFYFHMINSKLEDGEHHEKDEPDRHTPEQLLMMQSQDLKYITLKLTAERKKIERLKARLQLIGLESPPNTHVVFDEDGEGKSADEETLGVEPSLANRFYNRPRTSQLADMEFPGIKDDDDEHLLPRVAKQAAKSYKELEKRLDRERELSIVRRKLELKMHIAKAKKEDDKPTRIQPATETTPPVYVWKNIRKR